MKKLFETVSIGKVEAKNRIVRSATLENVADEGRFSKENIRIYEELAKGGTGVIITGMMGIDNNSRVSPGMINTCDVTFVEEFRKIVDMVHSHGSTIVVQLSHCGSKAALTEEGGPPLAPSKAEALPGRPARAMTVEEISQVVAHFSEAALKCKEAGADGVQIHGAHGYLISQFLSPYFNQRTDKYGGSIENRSRIVFEVYDAMRTALGADYPIWIKINSSDLVENGLTQEESLYVCQELDKRGIDAVEVSAGLGTGRESSPSRLVREESEEGSFAEAGLAVARQVKASVISVGGYRTPEMLEQWLNKGKIEAISMCRPLISEPALASRWKNGERSKARCISCNKCFRPKGAFGCQAF